MDVEILESVFIADGKVNGAAAVENSIVSSKKKKNKPNIELLYNLAIALLSIYPKELKVET